MSIYPDPVLWIERLIEVNEGSYNNTKRGFEGFTKEQYLLIDKTLKNLIKELSKT